MGAIVTSAVRARVGNSGPGGAARFDRHFIFTTAAIAILSGVAVSARPGLFLPVLMLDLWLLGYHHVVSTYTRLCFDADSFRRRRWMIFGLLPGVFAAVAVIGATAGLWLLATIYLYWQWFHYTRQSYGIARAYSRAGSPRSSEAVAQPGGRFLADPRLEYAVFYLVPLWGILHRAHQAPETFLGQPVWHPPVPAAAVDIVAGLALAGLVWWTIGRVVLWRRRQLAAGHTLYVLSHFAVFYTGYVAIDSIDAGWIALNIWHNAQYIAFVWLQNNRRFDGTAAQGKAVFLGWLSQRRNLWAYLAVCLGISTAFYGGLQWTAAAAGIGMAMLMVVYQTVNFHHYIVDALIWRRPRNTKPQATG